MKKCIVKIFVFLTLATGGLGQTKNSLKDPLLGVHIGLFDFETAEPTRITPLLGMSFLDGISKHFDYAVSLYGSSVKYPYREKPASELTKLLFELDASGRFKLLNENHIVVPYLSVGIGTSLYASQLAVLAPLGGGLQFRLGKGIFLFSNFQYRIPLSENASYHFLYDLGIAGTLKFRKAKNGQQISSGNIKVDIDHDGISDDEDKCPTIAGGIAYKGCPEPDTDGDHINDEVDKCPTVPGIPAYNGCPIPDADNDGLNDEEDKCSLVFGLLRYRGCPIPDTDKDSLNDEIDKCPYEAGPVSNNGCPLKNQPMQERFDIEAKNIFFKTGKAVLLPESFKSLNAIGSLLSANPSLKVTIEGHTDNTGNTETNNKLSRARAEAVLEYLTDRGINKERFFCKGFGSSFPIADNSTKEGKAMNRRVKLKIID